MTTIQSFSGNVGIGTASPGNLLTVNNSTTDGTVCRLVGGNGASALVGPSLDFSISNLPTYTGASIKSLNLYTDGSGQGAHLAFYTSNWNGSSGSLQQRMTILDSGYVGIGTASPGTALDVYTADGAYGMRHTTGTISSASYISAGSPVAPAQFGTTTNHKLGFYTNNGSPSVIIDTNGRVGIGTASPGYPLHVASTTTEASGTFKYFNSGSTGLQSSSAAYASIYAGSSIVAADAIVASDQRIKKLEDPPESFLDIVDKLKVHQYSYIDKVTKHADKQFGFFAQEVREILPGAVKFTDGIIPTIYRQAETFTSNSVTLTNHGLKVGANLQMFSYMSDDSVIEVNATVTVIIDENVFEVSTTSPLGGTKLFILGEKVSDFHNLNYDYVSSVGFGGLKELHALVKTQQKTIEALEARLAAAGL